MKKRGMTAVLLLSFILPCQALADSPDFKDITDDFWAEAEIEYLAQQEVISGYSNGNFHPNNTVKRSQAAAMIVEALELQVDDKPDPRFTDVGEDFHAYRAAAAVKEEGIMSGKDGAFMPNESLTRGQMAAVINRSFLLTQEKDTDYFRDVNEADAFYDDIQAVAQAGIANGYEDRTFGPNDEVTRAQFAVFLARAMDSGQFVNLDRTTYSNARFGFEVTYPEAWPEGEEAANGDGKLLYETGQSTIRAYGTHYMESQAPDLSDYEEVALYNGNPAYYKTTRSEGMIEFDLVRITDEMEYHVNGEVTEAFYSENGDHLRDTIYSLDTSDASAVEAHAAADKALEDLKNEDMSAFASHVHPEEGVRFTPYAHVDPDEDQHFTQSEAEELWDDNTSYEWGYYDGRGNHINTTFSDYYDEFIYDRDYLNAAKTSVNERIGPGNTVDNTEDIYPEAEIVEYHFEGEQEEYAGMDWSSLRLAMKKEDGGWYVTGVIHDEWTI
ncbi:S-layer homology domain-containing protein [Salibacterium aidingense]|uniref:S-layer homology domain-containing protein n=1 Tax=Salibacterium aidingense TaxID=384933 RepID=UPI003BEAABD7